MIHPTAEVESGAQIGPATRIWHFVHVREGAIVGAECNIGNNVFIDSGAVVGSRVKIQNRVSIYRGVTLEDGVFIGPHVAFTNDKYPRAITPEGELVSEEDWTPVPTLVKYGASIGAGAVILAGVTIGRWAMVGAAAVVTKDVPDHGLVTGTPAHLTGYACSCGRRLEEDESGWCCYHCNVCYNLPPLEPAR